MRKLLNREAKVPTFDNSERKLVLRNRSVPCCSSISLILTAPKRPERGMPQSQDWHRTGTCRSLKIPLARFRASGRHRGADLSSHHPGRRQAISLYCCTSANQKKALKTPWRAGFCRRDRGEPRRCSCPLLCQLRSQIRKRRGQSAA